jgi:hypothetical protein
MSDAPKAVVTPGARRLTPEQSINSNIRKILLTSPTFPRLYADVILRCAPNSCEANILRPHYQTICERVNLMSNQKGTCTHIKVSGVRCGSPALKGEQFCYFHQNVHRGVRRPKQSRLHPIALIEDEDSIQYALMEVINALMRNTIDYKRAALILRALHIAVKNASRVKYGLREPVKQVPDYAPWTEEQAELATQSELPAVSEIPYKPVAPGDPHFWEDQCEGGRVLAREAQARKASVGTDAFVRPGREATVPAPATPPPDVVNNSSSVPPIPAVSPHNFPKTQPTLPPNPTNSAPRKPPQPTAPAPKERKNKAHAVRHG